MLGQRQVSWSKTRKVLTLLTVAFHSFSNCPCDALLPKLVFTISLAGQLVCLLAGVCKNTICISMKLGGRTRKMSWICRSWRIWFLLCAFLVVYWGDWGNLNVSIENKYVELNWWSISIYFIETHLEFPPNVEQRNPTVKGFILQPVSCKAVDWQWLTVTFGSDSISSIMSCHGIKLIARVWTVFISLIYIHKPNSKSQVNLSCCNGNEKCE